MVTVVTDKQEFQPGSAENWPNLAIALCCRTMQIIRLFVWIVAFRIFFFCGTIFPLIVSWKSP